MFSKHGFLLFHHGLLFLGCLGIHFGTSDQIATFQPSTPDLNLTENTTEYDIINSSNTSSPGNSTAFDLSSAKVDTTIPTVTNKATSTSSTLSTSAGPTTSSTLSPSASPTTSSTLSPPARPTTSSKLSTSTIPTASTSRMTPTPRSLSSSIVPVSSTPSTPSTTALTTSTTILTKHSSVPTVSFGPSAPSGGPSDHSIPSDSSSTMSLFSSSYHSNGTSSAPPQTSHTASTARPIVTQTTRLVTTESFKSKSGLSPGVAFGILIVALSLLVLIGLALFYYIKKNRRKSYIPCHRKFCICCKDLRKRRSSTSSGAQLTSEEVAPTDLPVPRQERELFSIGDLDGGDDGRPDSRQRRGTEDDYFYDEIFERSAFVDERTNRSNKRLTVEDEDDDEDDELHIPDLVFKRPSTNT